MNSPKHLEPSKPGVGEGILIPDFEDHSYWRWKYNKADIDANLKIVKRHLKEMKREGIKFDGVVVCGTSGSWLAPLLTMDGIDVVLVRKSGENSHGRQVEAKSKKLFKKLVFVDDLIATGSTLEYVVGKVEAAGASVVAYSLYRDTSHTKWEIYNPDEKW